MDARFGKLHGKTFMGKPCRKQLVKDSSISKWIAKCAMSWQLVVLFGDHELDEFGTGKKLNNELSLVII